jgi:hypothetical protein
MVRVSSRNLHIRALNSYNVSAALGQTYPSACLLLPTDSQHHNLHTQMKTLELMCFNTDNTLSNAHSELSVACSTLLATGSIRYIYCTASTHRTTQHLQWTVRHLQPTIKLSNRTRKHGEGSENSSYFVCNVNILRIL